MLSLYIQNDICSDVFFYNQKIMLMFCIVAVWEIAAITWQAGVGRARAWAPQGAQAKSRGEAGATARRRSQRRRRTASSWRRAGPTTRPSRKVTNVMSILFVSPSPCTLHMRNTASTHETQLINTKHNLYTRNTVCIHNKVKNKTHPVDTANETNINVHIMCILYYYFRFWFT